MSCRPRESPPAPASDFESLPPSTSPLLFDEEDPLSQPEGNIATSSFEPTTIPPKSGHLGSTTFVHTTIMAWSQVQEIGEHTLEVKAIFVSHGFGFACGLLFHRQESRIPFEVNYSSS